MDDNYEILAEWTIRKLRDIDIEKADKEKILRWVLYSLGVKDLGIDIYLYLRNARRSTTTEIAEKFNISPTTARKYLEQLHSLGLVDYIGREYHLTRDDLSGCIREILMPRIKKVLDDIAEMADAAEYGELRGRRISIRRTTDELREAIDQAREEALKSINNLIEKGINITPEILNNILSKTFSAINEALNRVGDYLAEMERKMKIWTPTVHIETIWPLRAQRPPKPPRHPSYDRGYVRGKSIVETKNNIVYRIYSSHRLKRGDFEYAKKTGKKMRVNVFGHLEIDRDVGPEYADVVESMKIYGYMEGPKEFIDALGSKLIVYGHVEYI
mgnify:CR=1 FL=1